MLFKDRISCVGINLISKVRPSEGGSTTGQAMVEFLLVAPLFFFLIFAVFDFGHLFLVQMEVENAVQEAGRFASTGNHLPDPKEPRAVSLTREFDHRDASTGGLWSAGNEHSDFELAGRQRQRGRTWRHGNGLGHQ